MRNFCMSVKGAELHSGDGPSFSPAHLLLLQKTKKKRIKGGKKFERDVTVPTVYIHPRFASAKQRLCVHATSFLNLDQSWLMHQNTVFPKKRQDR